MLDDEVALNENMLNVEWVWISIIATEIHLQIIGDRFLISRFSLTTQTLENFLQTCYSFVMFSFLQSTGLWQGIELLRRGANVIYY